MVLTRQERVLIHSKEERPVVGEGYVSLNELSEGQHTVLVIPGKGAFIVYKLRGNYYNTRLYEGAPR